MSQLNTERRRKMLNANADVCGGCVLMSPVAHYGVRGGGDIRNELQRCLGSPLRRRRRFRVSAAGVSSGFGGAMMDVFPAMSADIIPVWTTAPPSKKKEMQRVGGAAS